MWSPASSKATSLTVMVLIEARAAQTGKRTPTS
jgi:hypothetical protein